MDVFLKLFNNVEAALLGSCSSSSTMSPMAIILLRFSYFLSCFWLYAGVLKGMPKYVRISDLESNQYRFITNIFLKLCFQNLFSRATASLTIDLRELTIFCFLDFYLDSNDQQNVTLLKWEHVYSLTRVSKLNMKLM